MQYDKYPILLSDGTNTIRSLLPLLSLGKDTARLNPKLSTSPMARIISLVWPTRLIFLAMGEVFSFGFNLAVSFPSDSSGSKARIVLLPSRIKRWGLYHIA